MENYSFNMRQDSPEAVRDLQLRAKKIREQRIRTKVLSQLLEGKTVDLMQSTALFEALNRERMEFDEILRLHPEQGMDCVEQAREDREAGRVKSKANWACRGHIPPCLYHARPPEYWKNKKILMEFFRLYPKFAVVK